MSKPFLPAAEYFLAVVVMITSYQKKWSTKLKPLLPMSEKVYWHAHKESV